MALTPEHIKELKKQLKLQVDHLPPDKKQEALDQIEQMSPEAIETMLTQQQAQQQVYRAIVEGKIPSHKIEENAQAIAVLDTRPLTIGHTIIIPKTPITKTNDLPDQALLLAKAISKRITSKLNATGTKIQTEFKFGEIIIEVIPIYDKPPEPNAKPQETTEKELTKIQNKLKVEKKPEIIKINKPKSSNEKPITLKRRIP